MKPAALPLRGLPLSGSGAVSGIGRLWRTVRLGKGVKAGADEVAAAAALSAAAAGDGGDAWWRERARERNQAAASVAVWRRTVAELPLATRACRDSWKQ